MGKLYLVLQDLGPFRDGKVIPKDTISELKRVSVNALETLLDRDVITEVQTPPLEILPGWEERAEKLKEVGIETIGDLVTADIENVAEELNVPAEGVQEAADEARNWIGAKEEEQVWESISTGP